MANKQISDLLEATVIDDAVFFAGEDGISTKKVKSKTLQDYIRTKLFFNFYATERLASAITLKERQICWDDKNQQCDDGH
jgi:hypothetical protein